MFYRLGCAMLLRYICTVFFIIAPKIGRYKYEFKNKRTERQIDYKKNEKISG